MSDTGLDSFETGEMATALSTVSKAIPDQNFIGAPKDKDEAEAKAREHNWPEKVPYDYSAYQPGNKGDVDLLAPTMANGAAASAARYEWKDEFGDVGPKIAELEEILFTPASKYQAGTARHHIQGIITEIIAKNEALPIMRFEDAGLHPVVLETLKLMHYTQPTPIQTATIPCILQGRDIVASAQTGSGKTAAYLIPVISRLMGKAKKLAAKRPDPTTFNPKIDRVRAEPLVLIVCPTRELALQIFDECRSLCYRTMLRPCVVYGGGPLGKQLEELAKGADILVATPGRLRDIMNKPSVLSLRRVRYTIIDEADELMHGDWEEDMAAIMGGGDLNEDSEHHYYMFSATFPKEYRKIAKTFMEEDFVRIRVGRTGSTHVNVKQTIQWVEESNKKDALWDLLFKGEPCRTMIFVNTKRQADMVDDYLFNKGLPSTSIHSDRTQREREDSILSFRQGTCPILVTTGVAARGLDIKLVKHIINYDLPSGMHGGIEEYVHRIGRTARIGFEGCATSFYNERNEDLAPTLCKLLIENGQEVPDFLEDHKPLDGNLDWDDDSEPEDEVTNSAATGDAWGGGSGGDSAWGAGAAEPTDSGFKAEGFTADTGSGAGASYAGW